MKQRLSLPFNKTSRFYIGWNSQFYSSVAPQGTEKHTHLLCSFSPHGYPSLILALVFFSMISQKAATQAAGSRGPFPLSDTLSCKSVTPPLQHYQGFLTHARLCAVKLPLPAILCEGLITDHLMGCNQCFTCYCV